MADDGTPDAAPDDQHAVSEQDPEASGGDAEAAASVDEREAVARDDDELFEDGETDD